MSQPFSLSLRSACLAALALVVVFLAGCFSSRPPTPNYYKDATFQGVAGDDSRVEFDLHISSVPNSPSPRIAQLPERALAALVQVYGAHEDLRKGLPALLAAPLARVSSIPSFDDSLVRFTKRFTFTIVPRNFHPADRLYSATLTAEAPEGWVFTEWRGFQAKDRTVNLAKIEAALAQKYGASLKLAPPQIVELAEAGVEASRERTESMERALDFEVVEFLPRLDDEAAELTLNAPFPQINVAGSYSVDVTFEYKHPAVQRFVEFTFKAGELKGHRLRALRYVPDLTEGGLESPIPNQVLKKVVLTYVERRVFDPGVRDGDTGAATADEGDDVATYRERRVHPGREQEEPCPSSEALPWEVDGTSLLKTDEVEAVVVVALLDGKPVFFYDLYAHQRPSDAQCLIFRDGAHAQAFANWVSGDPVNRVSGQGKDGREWRLQIDRDDKRVDLDGANLQGKIPIFRFEPILLNNPHQVLKLRMMGCH